MVRKIAVNIGEQRVMLTRQELDELLDHLAGGAVAGVPADAEAAACIAGEQPPDIIVENIGVADAARPGFPVAALRKAADFLNVLAEKGAVLKHHLEAIIIAGIMAAGYLYAAIHF